MYCTCIVDSLKRFILFRHPIVYRSPEIVVTRLSVFSNSRRRRKLYDLNWDRKKSKFHVMTPSVESSPDYFGQEWRICVDCVLNSCSIFRASLSSRWINPSPESYIFSIEERERGARREKGWKILWCRSCIIRGPLRPRKTMAFAS